MPIIPFADQEFDLATDVCVVGAGACGLTAGIAAARGGAEVIVFERDETPYGATGMGYGSICAAASACQRGAGVDDSADALFDDIMIATRGKTDRDIARVMAEESGPTIDWLCDTVGCDLQMELNWTGYGHSVPRMHVTPGRSGEELISMLMRGAEEAGVTLVTQATVRDLIVDAKGRVRGLVYESPDGDLTVGCGALILASSGYGANPDLIAKHIPGMKDATYHGWENHRGDAVLWGEAMGAELADMGAYQGLGTLADPQAVVVPHTVMIAGGYQVNIAGKRFENELENISGQGRKVIAQPDGISWVIYDQRGHDMAVENYASYRDAADLITNGRTADGMAELAERIRVDSAGLSQTAAEVDALRLSGEPCPFGRRFMVGEELQPPFYAAKVTGALFHTQGGLRIDGKARVLGMAGAAFPNLFAGGGAARSVSGPSDWGYLPAMGVATATVFGRLAGENAAALVTATR